ncbi:MAG: hypothetical protein ACRBCJ_14620 [Hyphomicrobiaceae bacterium]
MLKAAVVFTLVLFCWALVASAANISSVEGRVLINKGDGFRPVNGVTNVVAGDIITVRGTGRAVIQFDNGCSASILSNQTVTVPAKAPCTADANPNDLVAAGLALAGQTGLVIAISQDDDDPISP